MARMNEESSVQMQCAAVERKFANNTHKFFPSSLAPTFHLSLFCNVTA